MSSLLAAAARSEIPAFVGMTYAGAMRTLLAILAVMLTLSACNRREEPVANKYERQKTEIEAKAHALEAQVENDVSATEARLQNEVDTLTQNQPASAEATNSSNQVDRQR